MGCLSLFPDNPMFFENSFLKGFCTFHQTLLLTLLVGLRLVCNAGWQLDRECAEVGAGKMAGEVA